MKILVVDDEQNIVELLKFNLTKAGFDVIAAFDGVEAVKLALQEKPDLIILDVMLPGFDGLEVCRNLRSHESTSQIPIIMLTARAEELDKIIGLEMGADDYVTKPFSQRELLARVKARLRRIPESMQTKEENKVERGGISLYPEKYEVYVNGRKEVFTPKEFELLRLLMNNPGRVFSRDYLLEKIWGYDYLGDTRTVDVHIRHIRQKIEDEPSDPQYIETIRGVGYKFKEIS